MNPASAVRTRSTAERSEPVLSRAIGWLGNALDPRTSAVEPRPVGVRVIAQATWMTALDLVSAIRTKRAKARDRATPPVTALVTIHAPPAEVYAHYRQLSELPAFMDYLVAVREADDQWSHWVARVPSGMLAWDVKITDDCPGELIAWRSVKGSVIDVRGRVSFAPVQDGAATLVRLEIRLGTIATRRGRELAILFNPSQLEGDLRRFKHLLEAPSPPSPQRGGDEHRPGEHRPIPDAW